MSKFYQPIELLHETTIVPCWSLDSTEFTQDKHVSLCNDVQPISSRQHKALQMNHCSLTSSVSATYSWICSQFTCECVVISSSEHVGLQISHTVFFMLFRIRGRRWCSRFNWWWLFVASVWTWNCTCHVLCPLVRIYFLKIISREKKIMFISELDFNKFIYCVINYYKFYF